ncbi:MAG: B12-binding domain-containing radical SAM protein [Deltaproteobacteria bacterium]|nr:B12-binding domain-containing radical SAM protein [Deltaproteobacteria bacterium]
MKPHILLINPWIHDFAAFDLWAKPLGLLYLAAMLRQARVEVRLLDCLDRGHPEAEAPRIKKDGLPGAGRWRREIIPTPPPLADVPRYFARYGWPLALFRREVAAGPKPDLILVTSIMTYWYPGVTEAVGIVKEIWPDVPTVLGGIYATLCPEHARRHSGADIVLAGPGEKSLPSILSGLAGIDTNGLKGWDWRSVWPALDLYPKLDFAPLLTSRGCPGKCPYCSSRLLFPFYTPRETSDVVSEIEDRYHRWSIRHFTFFDDALLIRSETHLMPILDEVCRRDIRISFHAPNGLHVNLITRELAALMFQAGFKTIRLGLESLDPERQSLLGGKVLPGDFEAAVSRLLEAGFAPHGIGVYILCGLPGQDPAELQATVEVVRAMGVRPYFAEYSPLPGTALWDQAVAASPFDLSGEPLYQNNSFFPCRGPGFSWREMWELKREAKTFWVK